MDASAGKNGAQIRLLKVAFYGVKSGFWGIKKWLFDPQKWRSRFSQ
jgi:hypothetical protein